MARTPELRYDKGTLILHPPPRGAAWLPFVTWDDRIERFRVPASDYAPLLTALRNDGIAVVDKAAAFQEVTFDPAFEMAPYEHQSEALRAWLRAGRRGVVVLPTAAGKSYLAQLAMEATPRSTLVLVPTKPLLAQWYENLVAAFPQLKIGVLGGGDHDGLGPLAESRVDLLVCTYTSAAIHAETLGNRYGLIVFDECHNLPTDFYRASAELSIAPYRLGLTATPERADGRHSELDRLIGPQIYRRSPDELSGIALAEYETVQIKVNLTAEERSEYEDEIGVRDRFLREEGIRFGGNGWQRFVWASARSADGRRAMLAHHRARQLAFGAEGKLRVLAHLLHKHYPDRTIIFTNDNATVHEISERFLLPAITHETPTTERHRILKLFREGRYHTVVTSRVLNEGVDVPNARIGIMLSGTGSRREFIQRLGRLLRRGDDPNKRAILYELVAEDTTEEGTSRRRRKPAVQYDVNRDDGPQQLGLGFT
ncbi:MAG: DEAD/DEAH box helicase family protein [Anaerolineales bacterium]|nr:DEAD/DEAH box helicase family protein [Anaerolineales bacterium]